MFRNVPNFLNNGYWGSGQAFILNPLKKIQGIDAHIATGTF